MLIKTDHQNYYRDPMSNAIVNVDKEGYDAYKKQKDILLRSKNVIQEVDEIRKEMNEIKELLYMIVNKETK